MLIDERTQEALSRQPETLGPSTDGQVARQINNLEKTVAGIAECIDALHSRLEPVMYTEPPDDRADCEQESVCDMAHKIRMITDRLDECRRAVVMMTDNLQL